MRQHELMRIVSSLKEGQCIAISKSSIWEATRGSLSSLIFDSVRESDVNEFIIKIQENWEVDVSDNFESRSYTFRKRRTNEKN